LRLDPRGRALSNRPAEAHRLRDVSRLLARVKFVGALVRAHPGRRQILASCTSRVLPRRPVNGRRSCRGEGGLKCPSAANRRFSRRCAGPWGVCGGGWWWRLSIHHLLPEFNRLRRHVRHGPPGGIAGETREARRRGEAKRLPCSPVGSGERLDHRPAQLGPEPSSSAFRQWPRPLPTTRACCSRTKPPENLDPKTFGRGVSRCSSSLVRSEGLSPALIATHNYELSKKMDLTLMPRQRPAVERRRLLSFRFVLTARCEQNKETTVPLTVHDRK